MNVMNVMNVVLVILPLFFIAILVLVLVLYFAITNEEEDTPPTPTHNKPAAAATTPKNTPNSRVFKVWHANENPLINYDSVPECVKPAFEDIAALNGRKYHYGNACTTHHKNGLINKGDVLHTESHCCNSKELVVTSTRGQMTWGRENDVGNKNIGDDKAEIQCEWHMKCACEPGYGAWELGGKECSKNCLDSEAYNFEEAVQNCNAKKQMCEGIMFKDGRYYLRGSDDRVDESYKLRYCRRRANTNLTDFTNQQ